MTRPCLVVALALLLAACSPDDPTGDSGITGEVNCIDRSDNDNDGKTDCDDSDCASDSACRPPEPRPCEAQLDCGNIVSEMNTLCCLGSKCVPPGPADERTGKPLSREIQFELTFHDDYAQMPTDRQPKSVVIRFIHPDRIGGGRLTCADVLAKSGGTQDTRNLLDQDRSINQVYRNLYPMNWQGGSTNFKFPSTVSQTPDVILFAEAWFGARAGDLNPTGKRVATDCKEGINLVTLQPATVSVRFPAPL